jgi:cytochrome c551/c552
MATQRTRRSVSVAVIVAVAVGLTACAGRPGTAATVDGEPVSEAELAQTVADWTQIAPANPATVLQELVISPFVIDAAAQAGVGASEEDGRAILRTAAEAAGTDPADLHVGPGLLLVGQRFAAQQAAQEAGRASAVEQAATEAIGAADIQVSPRYGTWEVLGVVEVENPWFVGAPTPASAATPTP